jgi:hypothetical protein
VAGPDVWEMLIGRTEGPFTFRLLVQPAMATFFAIRAGLRDAREQNVPYLAAIVTDRSKRSKLLVHGIKDVGRVFLFAFVLDVIYEVWRFGSVYPLQSVVVAVLLALIPYLLIRGPVTRIARRMMHR